jgi:small redox-active disulfide protein 2
MEIMNILVLGTGCHKCKTLAQVTEQAVAELGISAEIGKVTDIKEIMALGVMMTPALSVNGTIKVSGRVPGIAEIKAMLQ